MSVGYKKEMIKSYFGNFYDGMEIHYSAEEEPLGTGGAVLQALSLVSDPFLLLNGDTLFWVDLAHFETFFSEKSADIAIALKQVEFNDRYGVVQIDSEDRVVAFEEKKAGCGLINGGVYLMRKKVIHKLAPGRIFSLEKDFLEKHVRSMRIYGYICPGYMIDIGVEEDYLRSQVGLPRLFSALS